MRWKPSWYSSYQPLNRYQVLHGPDYAVRPSLRIAGASFLGLMAWLFLQAGISVLFMDSLPLDCAHERGRSAWFCQGSVWILRLFPVSMQGALIAISAAIIAAGCLYFARVLLLGLKRPGGSGGALAKVRTPDSVSGGAMVGRCNSCGAAYFAGATDCPRCNALVKQD